MKDICIIQPLIPTLLIEIGEVLGRSGVNIEGLSFAAMAHRAIVHLLVNDEQTALAALQQANFMVTAVSDVCILYKDRRQVTGKPGSFGGICRLLNEHGLTIQFGYPAENNRYVFGVDDIEKAQQLLA